jgi:putative oxidoreductase
MEFFAGLHQLNDWALVVARLALGVIFWIHGRMKMGTWKMQPSEQMPKSILGIVRMLSIAEPLGALAMVFGLLTQVTAVCFGLVMVAAIPARRKQGAKFLDMKTTGWELDFLILAVSIALAVQGAGQYSLDRFVFGI